jgi:hypothetical protein
MGHRQRLWYICFTILIYRGSLGKLCPTPELTGLREISLTLVGEPGNQTGSNSGWNLRSYAVRLNVEDVKPPRLTKVGLVKS